MKTAKYYVPERGDVIWIDLDPVKGHEQRGRRPVLVLTPKSYNQKSGLMIISPITSKIKGYPFEVDTKTNNKKVTGAILSDQLRTIDWQARYFKKIDRLSKNSLEKVLDNIHLLFEK